MKRNSLIQGAIILTAANIITRILGFVYRIYMSNTIGAEGMGLYQLIMPIYMLCWSISSSGFTTTVSKLTAQENAKRNYGNMGRVLKQSILITGSIGLLLSIVLFFFADFISGSILKDGRVFISLKLLSFSFPFMAAGSCIRGYFNGLMESKIPALSQVLEQLIRMGVVFILGSAFIPMGIDYACAVAVVGITAGELISFLFVAFSYYLFKRKNSLNKKPTWSAMTTINCILSMAIPISANRIVGSMLVAVENVLIPQKLQQFGSGVSEAMSQYGQLTGMAMPLVQFPSAMLMALSITLVPAVSEATAIKNNSRVVYTVGKTFLFSAVVGIGATAVFMVFPYEVGYSIFKQETIGLLLLKMSVLCPFLYMQITMSGILNGLGEQMFIFKNNLLSSAINIGFIFFLVPKYGINAFLFSWFATTLMSCSFCIYKVCKRTSIVFDFKNWIYKPIISALAAGLITRFISHKFIFGNMASLLAVFISVAIMLAMYVFFLISLKGISKEDINMITRSMHK